MGTFEKVIGIIGVLVVCILFLVLVIAVISHLIRIDASTGKTEYTKGKFLEQEWTRENRKNRKRFLIAAVIFAFVSWNRKGYGNSAG